MIEPTNRRLHPWTLALAALTAVAVALSGCAHDDYYCDSTGCYYCDGVGCRPVSPPSRTPCAGDWACSAGQICTSAGCVASCRTNSDCAHGWVCRVGDGGTTGECLAPTEVTPTPTPGACTSDANCQGGTVCINGTCQHSATPSCTADTDCPSGNVCVSGVCTPTTNTCQFNNQCGPGRLCVNSACVDACGSGGTACPTGLTCVTAGGVSYCQAPVTPACVHDSDCASGDRCVNAMCLVSCTAGGASCPTGYYCGDNSVCVVDTRPQPFCDATHPCAAGSTCVGGVCRVACTSNTQCQMTDVTYRNCASIPSMPSNTQTYCLTDNEYRPMCSRQSQCNAGQSCIDGACH